MEQLEDLAKCQLSQMNQDFREFISHEVSHFKEKAFDAKEKTKTHARKISRCIYDAAWCVCHFSSLPHWLQDNDYLLHGHRPQIACWKTCLKSVFRLHTETGNIWTHGLGVIIFLCLSLYHYCWSPYHTNWTDNVVFGIYFLAVTCCLAFSTIFHTFSCHSHEVGKLCGKLDYCGITLLSTGSFIPWIHYAFNCKPEHRIFYLTFVTILGLFVAWFSLRDKFGTAPYRVIRASVFTAFGLSIAFPFCHWMISVSYVRISLFNVFLVALFYIGGAFLYAMRIPERFFPGKCDYWFQSHQIFHIFVIIAAILHYIVIHDIASLKTKDGASSSPSFAGFVPKDYSSIAGPIISSNNWNSDHCDL